MKTMLSKFGLSSLMAAAALLFASGCSTKPVADAASSGAADNVADQVQVESRALAEVAATPSAADAAVTPQSPRDGLKEGVAAYEAGNLALAYQEFRAAAEIGDANCQFNLALMYEQGIAVAKDEKQAVAWYRKSAEQGNSSAQFNLGVLYEHGRGCAVDFAQANQWYRHASLQGDALAIGNLGMLYLRGDGVNVDKIAGLALLLQSASLDNSPQNHAKMNIAQTKGLTPELIAAAQKLADELSESKNLLVPLDQYLKNQSSAADNAK